jgi:hypothetical protein
MPSPRKKAKAVPFNPAEVAQLATHNPYIQRLMDDVQLRDNVQKAIESSKSAYGRLSNGKTPAKALLEDKKLQKDLGDALEALRDATLALTEKPRKRARKSVGFGRKLMILGLGFGLALAGSEKLRSKVLDALFGAEEEFEYTPPAAGASTPPASPVSAA